MNHITNARTIARGFRFFAIAALLALLTGLLAIPQPARADETFEVEYTTNDGIGSLRWAIDQANGSPGNDTITFAAATDGHAILLAGTVGEDANAGGDLDIFGSGDLTIHGNGTANTIIDGGTIDRVFHICPGGGCTNTVTLSGMTIQNGKVIFSGGGGIRIKGGTTIVDSSTIRENKALNGGGIANFATLTIQNGSIIGGADAGNQTTGSSGNGGGIYNYAGTLTVDHSVVSANTAGKNGGGIWSQVPLNVQNGTTIGGPDAANVAENGGGIFNKAGTTTVDGSVVRDNGAELGGGIHNSDTLIIENGSSIGVTGAGNTADGGGGIYNDFGTMTVDGSTISGNTAVKYGGGINNNFGTTIINSSIVSANTADYGGGISSWGTLTVQNGSIIGGAGAGNTATLDGGGIYSVSGTTTLSSSTVSTNTADHEGGGVFNDDTLIVQNGSIIGGFGAGNTARRGGGVYNNILGTATVTGSTVSANTAAAGGGIDNEGTLMVENGSIIGGVGAGNMADSGGGIYSGFGNTTVDGSTVSANMAENGGGINNSGILTIQNGSTIGGVGAGNIANNYGGGIYNSVSTMTVTGSRFLNNTAANGGGVYNNRDTDGATSVTSSCIVGNSDWSYYNNQPAQQIATGNWWGAAGGPIAPGADSVFGNVDVGGALNTPILGCAPELQVSKANDTGGNGTVGTPFHWTLTVRNTGLVSATFETPQTILIDDLPAGPTYGSPVTGSFVDVPNSENVLCSLASNTLTCDAAGGDVTLGAITGSFEVTISVTPSAQVTLVNPAGICRVDPDGEVSESDETNNDCPANVVNIELISIYLPVVLK